MEAIIVLLTEPLMWIVYISIALGWYVIKSEAPGVLAAAWVVSALVGFGGFGDSVLPEIVGFLAFGLAYTLPFVYCYVLGYAFRQDLDARNANYSHTHGGGWWHDHGPSGRHVHGPNGEVVPVVETEVVNRDTGLVRR